MKESDRKAKLLKVFILVSVLIVSGLGMTMTLGSTLNESETGSNSMMYASATDVDSRDVGVSESRGEARQGVKVEIVPPPTTTLVFVGQQDFDFDVQLKSVFEDDDDDQNGDNVLYDVEITGTDAGITGDNLKKYDYTKRDFVNVTTPVFTWASKRIAPNSTNKSAYFLYNTSDPAKPYKYITNYTDNYTNTYLDRNNSGTIDVEEYWPILDGAKTFGNFNFDVLPDVPPGYYRMKFKVSYKYQIWQDVNTTCMGNGAGPVLPDGSLTTNEALGPFKYYFWYPIDTSDGQAIQPSGKNLTTVWGGGTGTLGYAKKLNYIECTDQISWEGLQDDGVDLPDNYFDFDNDGYTTWMPGDPDANMGAISTDFDTKIRQNFPTPREIDQPDADGNLNANQGNGTWTYSGYMNRTDPAIWGDTILHTEDVWFDFIINSTIVPEEDLNEDNITGNDLKLAAVDDDYFTGSTFEEFFVQLTNAHPTLEMRDVEARLVLPNVSPGGFLLYADHDTTTIKQIDSNDKVNMSFRISVDKATPPGFYYGQLVLEYTMRYPSGEVDPLGVPFTTNVRITEDHWVVQFKVDFTPDMGDASVKLASPGLAVRAAPSTEIDTSTGRQMFNFTVKNTGNVKLYGGDMPEGNLYLDYAEFEQSGEGFYDSDADPGVELVPISIDELDIGASVSTPIPVTIPNHWYLPEGKYRLYLDFKGFYYNNGALGNASGFSYMEMNWVGIDDDDQPRNCFVLLDTNGNDSVNDLDDSIRETEGIYTDIYIKQFDPTTKELAIVDYSPISLNQEDLEGGGYDFSVTFQNQQSFIMHNVDVEIDIDGYFDESNYYDWTYVTRRPNPKFHIDELNPIVANGTWTVDFVIDDLDKLLPEGEHHIPIKYSYDYEVPGIEDMTTYSIIWDTSASPFVPYIDANANFMLNKAIGGTRASVNAMDIIFVVDVSNYASNTYYTRLSNTIDGFVNDLMLDSIDYQLGLVAFRDHSWLVQDLTTDGDDIKNGLVGLTRTTWNCGVYDAVTETISNTLTAGGTISYRQGATKVIVLLTDYFPNEGANSELSFGLAVKGEAILFTIIDVGSYSGWYDETVGATGGQMYNVLDTDYSPFTSSMLNDIKAYIVGVTAAGVLIYDVPLRDVADPNTVDIDTYGPYLVVEVIDSELDIDAEDLTAPAISLGGRIRDVNVRIRLTNQENVQYTDIEVGLPVISANKNQTVFTRECDPINSSENFVGVLTSTTLGPKGGFIDATFNVDINTDIETGIHRFELVFKGMNDYTKLPVESTIPVAIRIYPGQPILIIPQINEQTGEPGVVVGNVEPGKEFSLTFTLLNTGGDDAREIYVTLSNDWYDDDPFTTIDTFVTSVSSYGTETTYYNNGNLRSLNTSRKANTKLSDIGISDTSDIINVERKLLAPTAVVPRFYIKEIKAGESYNVTFKLKADIHMVVGRPYSEHILLEYIDSTGLVFRYDETNPELSTKPLPVIVYTKKSGELQIEKEGLANETYAAIIMAVILIILVLLLIGSRFQKRKMKGAGEGDDESEPEAFDEDEELEEDEDDELPLPDDYDEELEEELPEDLRDEEETEGGPESDEPEDEDQDEPSDRDRDNDWDFDDSEKENERGSEDEEKKPAKGRGKDKGKMPDKDKGKDDDVEDW